MTGRGDRMTRAGDYVLGLMSETERQRAERDMEFDPDFRKAVMQLAERMHAFDRNETPKEAAGERWRLIARRLGELPQMRSPPADDASKPVIRDADGRPFGMGLHALPGRAAVLVALGLIAAFVLGYLASRL